MSDALTETLSSDHIARLSQLRALEERRDRAKAIYFAHRDPGGLSPSLKDAWGMEHVALYLMLKAAQTRFIAELELADLLDEVID